MRWTCRKIEFFLDDCLEGKLSVRDRFTYEAHVETCPGCREYFDHMSAFVEKVRQIGPRTRPRPRQMPQRILGEWEGLPLENQLVLAEAVRRDLEADDNRRKE